MPQVDPASAAAQAIELLDKDGNGLLNESELAASPGMLAAVSHYDSDGDRKVSQDEIARRFTAMYGSGTPWLSANGHVYLNGRPLGGADVRFVPAPFLKEALHTATGKTDSQGRVVPAVADDALPADKKGLTILQPGVYRVEIEHPQVDQPHKPLGCEIDMMVRGGTEPEFHL